MEEPLGVVAAVTYSPGLEKFLLVKRSDERENFPGYWEFPSGVIEEDEQVKDAAFRELREETSIVPGMLKEGEPHLVDSEYGEFRVHPVLAVVEHEDPELTEEHTDYRWLERNEISDLETVKALEKDLENVGINE